jgi:hypothetical protein
VWPGHDLLLRVKSRLLNRVYRAYLFLSHRPSGVLSLAIYLCRNCLGDVEGSPWKPVVVTGVGLLKSGFPLTLGDSSQVAISLLYFAAKLGVLMILPGGTISPLWPVNALVIQ